MEINKYGMDGRRRVLSIIANDFNYEVIKENLGVSNQFELLYQFTFLFKLVVFIRFQTI